MLQTETYCGLDISPTVVALNRAMCICPNSTNLGDAQWLYRQIQAYRADVGLRLIHHSHTTLTGADEPREMRLKYVELWFSARLEDLWKVRESWGEVTS